MTNVPASELAFDRASYRNRGSIGQRLVTRWKAYRYGLTIGAGVVIKSNAEFWMTEGAVLKIGNDSVIQNDAFFQLTKPNPKVIIGNDTVIGRHCMITAKNFISIGSNVLMGAFVQVIDHNHGMAAGGIIREQRAEIGTVQIGDDVWIGAGVKILMNARIGAGAVIGANAVVVGEVPPNAIVGGVPARVIKFRE